MIGSKKYVQFSGTCLECGMKFEKAEDAQRHTNLLSHNIKYSESFNVSSYVSDMIQLTKSQTVRLK
jgi:hypothetical protein